MFLTRILVGREQKSYSSLIYLRAGSSGEGSDGNLGDPNAEQECADRNKRKLEKQSVDVWP